MRPTTRTLTFLAPVLTVLTLAACNDRPYYDKVADRSLAEGLYRPATSMQQDRSYETLSYDQFEVKNGLLIAGRLNEGSLQMETATIGVLSRSAGMAWEVNPAADLNQQAAVKPALAETLGWFTAGGRLRLIAKDKGMLLTRHLNGRREQLDLRQLSAESAQGQLGKVTDGHQLLAKLKGLFADIVKKEALVLKEETVTVTNGGKEDFSRTTNEDFKDELEDGGRRLVRAKALSTADGANYIINGKYAGRLKFRLLRAGAGSEAQRLVVELSAVVDEKTHKAEAFLGAFSPLDKGGFALSFETNAGRGVKKTVRRTFVPASQLTPAKPATPATPESPTPTTPAAPAGS